VDGRRDRRRRGRRARPGLDRGAAAGSGAVTAGLANPVVASLELFGATATAILAIALPVIALLAAVAFIAVIYKLTRRVVGGRRRATA